MRPVTALGTTYLNVLYAAHYFMNGCMMNYSSWIMDYSTYLYTMFVFRSRLGSSFIWAASSNLNCFQRWNPHAVDAMLLTVRTDQGPGPQFMDLLWSRAIAAAWFSQKSNGNHSFRPVSLKSSGLAMGKAYLWRTLLTKKTHTKKNQKPNNKQTATQQKTKTKTKLKTQTNNQHNNKQKHTTNKTQTKTHAYTIAPTTSLLKHV